MTVTPEFSIDYLLDDCYDCPENKDGECMTQSHCFEVKQMAIKALKQMAKIGHWEIVRKYFFPVIYFKCSLCGDNVFIKTKYCPNCGARMESEE